MIKKQLIIFYNYKKLVNNNKKILVKRQSYKYSEVLKIIRERQYKNLIIAKKRFPNFFKKVKKYYYKRLKKIMKRLKKRHKYYKYRKIKSKCMKKWLIAEKKNSLMNFFFRRLITFFMRRGKKNKIIMKIFAILESYKYKSLRNKNFLLYYPKKFKYGLILKQTYKSGKKYYIPFPSLGVKKNKKLFFYFLKNIVNQSKDINLKKILSKILFLPLKNKKSIIKYKKQYNKQIKANRSFIRLTKKWKRRKKR